MKIYGYAAVLAVLLMIVLAASCANQAPPSGGPADKTPPAAVGQVPANGQVNVDTKISIEIKFAEWINRASAAGAVSMYPAVPQGVVVKVVKNRLTVTPKAPLSDNTTYRVSVSAALQDLRGNAIPKSIDIVFSTGAELDSGRVEGSVVSLKPKIPVHKVMLFAVDKDGGWTDGRYFSPPDYATQSDSAGAFGFSHIKEGRYRIVAFVDQYRTGKLRVGDTCFTSLEKVVDITKSAQTIRLYPAESDTSTVKKKSVVDSAVVVDTSKNKLPVDTVNTSHKNPVVDTVSIIDTSAIDTVNTAKKKSGIDTTGINTAKKKRIADSLCIRLSGGAGCLRPDERRKWVYRPINRRDTTSFIVADSAGTFAFDSIPASKGTLLWFIDDNGDNQITPGRLSPWRSPERFFVIPDTVEAKARWVVEGINVRGCEEAVKADGFDRDKIFRGPRPLPQATPIPASAE